MKESVAAQIDFMVSATLDLQVKLEQITEQFTGQVGGGRPGNEVERLQGEAVSLAAPRSSQRLIDLFKELLSSG
ncbi:hypothetical protein PBY51_011177 [Eleginops maclovinus]|uniref:Uncharacterized protein n=1 Tax=Eleginops maclovinus TaxID=56733 RepID=A0AAN7X5D9_ELEMC|nr:hypothetical protein PBY51_011177 [Eleginops maclovinus]